MIAKGFVLLQRLLPKRLLSRLAGALANSRGGLVKGLLINVFCLFYKVDLSEAVRQKKSDYLSFNDFFTRSLKPGARPVQGRISSPADGKVATLGRVNEGTIVQAKGVDYALAMLLGEEDCSRFDGGSFITIYLAPHNYHRFHLPYKGLLHRAHYFPGKLFSVGPATAKHQPNLFARNERLVSQFTAADGQYAYVAVGALLVAGIKPVWRDKPYKLGQETETLLKRSFAQGEEFGQFELGSSVILVFDWALDFAVEAGQPVRMGQPLVK